MDASLSGYVGERSIPVVVVENRAAIASDEEVDEAVVVEIGCDSGHSINVCGHSGLIGDVGEGTIAVIAIEVIVRRIRRRLLQRVGVDSVFQRLSTYDVEVGEAVVVVVEPNTAPTRALEQRAQFLGAETVGELDARFRGRIFKPDG